MKWYYSGCDAVVAPSMAVEKILRSYGIKKPVEVIKTGVVPVPEASEQERAEVRKRLGFSYAYFILLFVGRIAREKNITMLLKAFKRVVGKFPNTKLMLVGSGPALAETRRYVSGLGLEECVKFAGMMPRTDIEPIYTACDVFVFPSTTETQGIAICEALSAGLPVIAVNAGGIPENIQHECDGFLTQNNPDEFAGRIEYLISNPAIRAKMGMQARINAQQFSIMRMVDDFEQFYSEIIESKSPKIHTTADKA